MKGILGIVLIMIALVLSAGVYAYIHKKGTYKGDFLGLVIDSVEFLALIGALILVGIVLLAVKR